MSSTSLWVYAIGFIAQGFFSARILVQWILSERARRVLSPTVYWVFSLAGSILLFVYGWLRTDFSIMLGQLISYYIYVWNLNIKGVWKRIPFASLGLNGNSMTGYNRHHAHFADHEVYHRHGTCRRHQRLGAAQTIGQKLSHSTVISVLTATVCFLLIPLNKAQLELLARTSPYL